MTTVQTEQAEHAESAELKPVESKPAEPASSEPVAPVPTATIIASMLAGTKSASDLIFSKMRSEASFFSSSPLINTASCAVVFLTWGTGT